MNRKQIKFVVFARLPSYHELTAGRDWKVCRRTKREFMGTFFYAIKEGLQLAGFHHRGNQSYFEKEVLVHLNIFGRWQGPPDRDNYIQSAGKLIIDQLFGTRTRNSAAHLLVDDRFVKWGDVEFKRGQPMVEIVIEEV